MDRRKRSASESEPAPALKRKKPTPVTESAGDEGGAKKTAKRPATKKGAAKPVEAAAAAAAPAAKPKEDSSSKTAVTKPVKAAKATSAAQEPKAPAKKAAKKSEKPVPEPAPSKKRAKPADDSSDDDDEEANEEADTIALDPADEDKLKKRIKALGAPKSDVAPGVIYLGRIPHGFYEEQMKEYFSQFGEITRLRLSRNKKTGRSKHFAFLEFKNAEVAKIVADTMDNYLLFGHLLKCHVVEPSKVHPDTFKGANRKFTKLPWDKLNRERHNKPKTPEQRETRIKRLVDKEEAKRKKLAEVLGKDFEFGGYAAEVEKTGAKRVTGGKKEKDSAAPGAIEPSAPAAPAAAAAGAATPAKKKKKTVAA